jgi:CRISPR-associated endonuclease Cas2
MKAPLTLNLVLYDITHDRTLQKVAKLLQKHGYERINYSVWLGWNTFAEDTPLRRQLQQLMRNPNAEGSRLYTMPLKTHTLAEMRSISGHKPTSLDYWLGEQKILFF